MMPGFPPLPRSLAGNPSKDSILAPSPVYLTGEEQLRISSIGNASGVTLMVRGRVLKPDYTIAITEQPHTPNSNRTIATTTIALSEGWPLGFTVKATVGTPAYGAVWCLLELVRGQGSAAVVVETFGSGFVTASQPMNWPGGVNYQATDGPGCLRSVTGTQPGAGAEISETVPTGARWELLCVEADLVTSAAVANRVPVWTIDDGANVFYRAAVNGNEVASTTYRNILGPGFPVNNGILQNIATEGSPSGLKLGPGWRIRTSTSSIQAGDQWSAPQMVVLERFDL